MNEQKTLALQNHEKSQTILKEQIDFLRSIREGLGSYGNEERIKDLSYVVAELEKVRKTETETFWNFLRNE